MLVRLLLLWISLDRSNAALSFANYYGDHMVLQWNRANFVWGYTDTNTTDIFVNFTGYATHLAFVTYLDELQSFIWTVQLAPGHYQKSNITVYTHNETAQIRDVLFGDVWLCSGQSNMQFTMSMVDNASVELDDVTNYHDIRLFTVAEKTSNTEMLDVTVEQPWSIPSKASVGGKDWSYFSAVCWLYGKYLYQKLQYPIGLISTTWGGTPIEAWSSRDAMAACPTEGSPGKRIHPRDKQDIAARLALSGLAVAYKLNVGKFQGPRITAYQSYTDLGLYTIKPVFDNGTSPIEVRSKNGFELCCSINNQSKCDGKDSKWVEFPIVDYTDSTITLNYTNGCARQWIMGIRYAWRESPCDVKQCAIYSVENKLPMAPFITNGLINSP